MPTYGMKYVFTSPEKVFHNVDKVVKLVSSRFDNYFIVKEYGENADNPHLNVAILGGGQSFKNMPRDLKNAYYGNKLKKFMQIDGFSKHGFHNSGIPNETGLKFFANYLKKELSIKGELVEQKGVDIYALTEGMPEYNKEECMAIKEQRKLERKEKAEVIKALVEIHRYNEYGKPTIHTFQKCCTALAKRNSEGNIIIPLKPLLNRISIHYVLYCNELGDYEGMCKLIYNTLKEFEPVSHTD